MSSTSFTSSGMIISSGRLLWVETKNSTTFSKSTKLVIYQLKKSTDILAPNGTLKHLSLIWIILEILETSQPKTLMKGLIMPQYKSQTESQNKWGTSSHRSSSSKIKLEIFQGKLMRRRLKLESRLLNLDLVWQSLEFGKTSQEIRIIGDLQWMVNSKGQIKDNNNKISKVVAPW